MITHTQEILNTMVRNKLERAVEQFLSEHIKSLVESAFENARDQLDNIWGTVESAVEDGVGEAKSELYVSDSAIREVKDNLVAEVMKHVSDTDLESESAENFKRLWAEGRRLDAIAEAAGIEFSEQEVHGLLLELAKSRERDFALFLWRNRNGVAGE